MIVYLVALAEILFYLWMTPVHVAVYLRAENGFRASAGVALFERRFAKRRAVSKPPKTNAPGKRPLGNPGMLLRLPDALRRADISLSGAFSTGDAATTALLAGMAVGAEASLRPFVPGLRVTLTPDFNAARSYARLHGMISLNSGQIIRAALSGALKHANRRYSQWISIRSKA